MQLLPGLITDDFAYKDTVWAVRRPVVGAAAFRGYVEAMRTAYPDLMYEIQQVGGRGALEGGSRRGEGGRSRGRRGGGADVRAFERNAAGGGLGGGGRASEGDGSHKGIWQECSRVGAG